MPSIGDVAAEVRATFERIASIRAILTGALDFLETAGRTYTTMGEGSTQPDLSHAAACLEHAYDQIRGALASLDLACDHTHRYLAAIAGPTLSPHQVESLRSRLPEPIGPAQRGTGRKTHGIWIGSDGRQREIVSGEDDISAEAVRYLSAAGVKKIPWSVTHVELKLAALLRAQYERTTQVQHATLTLNNDPCPGRLGCLRLLPLVLPEGCSLTIHAPTYHGTSIGGTKS